MTVEEAKTKKTVLEEDLTALVKKFNAETGLIAHVETMYTSGSLGGVQTMLTMSVNVTIGL